MLSENLPNSLLVIFNHVAEAKVLACCALVSKRFHSLVPEANNIFLRVISSNSSSESQPDWNSCPFKPFWSYTLFLEYKHYFITTPCSAAQVLKNFSDVRSLRIEIPSGELGIDDGVLWKWKADFGSNLDYCVILAALMLNMGLDGNDDDNGSVPESYETNGTSYGTYWMVNSIIATRARHFWLRQIVLDHKGLVNLVVTDRDGQGVLCMNRDQLEEFRVKSLSDSHGFNNKSLEMFSMMRLKVGRRRKRKELSYQDAAIMIQVSFRAHLIRRSQALRALGRRLCLKCDKSGTSDGFLELQGIKLPDFADTLAGALGADYVYMSPLISKGFKCWLDVMSGIM